MRKRSAPEGARRRGIETVARRLVFVTGNAGKAHEARERFEPLGIAVVQRDLKLLEVQADDLVTVAREKARSAAEKVRGPFFLEDAGLFIPSLRGFPGVYSAHAFKTIGCEGILQLMRGIRAGRNAAFRAVVAYHEPGRKVRLFTGECHGTITTKMRGDLGFGFDPIFVPDDGDGRTFGESSAEEKNKVSHRGRALDALAAHVSRKSAHALRRR